MKIIVDFWKSYKKLFFYLLDNIVSLLMLSSARVCAADLNDGIMNRVADEAGVGRPRFHLNVKIPTSRGRHTAVSSKVKASRLFSYKDETNC